MRDYALNVGYLMLDAGCWMFGMVMEVIHYYPEQYQASMIFSAGYIWISILCLPAYRPSSIQAILPPPQQILAYLAGGFFPEFMKPGADYTGDIGENDITDLRIFLAKLSEAFAVDLDQFADHVAAVA